MIFKGYRQSLRLILPAAGDFPSLRMDLLAKLTASGDFFRGAKVMLDQSQRLLEPEEMVIVKTLLRENGVEIMEPDAAAQPQSVPGETTLTCRGAVRGGQKVVTTGNVLVLGDLHPGAEIEAGRDVYILGAARGSIAAGLISGMEAVVIAFSLRPALLRIGECITRSPAAEPLWQAEIARIRDGEIFVEPFTGWKQARSK